MEKRRWTKEEKLEILKEATEKGVEITLRKHGIFPATYYSWKKKFSELDGFKQENSVQQLQRIKELEKENFLLKKILAEKDLQLELKDQLIKKNYLKRR